MKILNSPKFANIAQNTMMAVGIETSLKAVGRPTFTYLDPHADKDSKKFSATKELLYQTLCLGIYFSVIPWFKHGGYKAAKTIFKNNEAVKQTLEALSTKIAITEKGKTKELSGFKLFMHEFDKMKKGEELPAYLKKVENSEEGMQKIKGSVEGVSIIGSILGLTILAPEISHVIIHPIMDALGIKSKKPAGDPNANKTQGLEKQA